MPYRRTTATLYAALLLLAMVSAGCASAPAPQSGNANSTTTTTTTVTNSSATTPTTSTSAPPVSSAHNGGGMLPGGSGAAPVAGQGTNEKPDLDTAALDTKIAQTEAKAKMASAKPADKLAAAEAYLDRGNVYMNAGSPRLYKFALADYRRVLRYQPDNQEARQNLDTIVGIYKQLGRPVPELGNEP